MWWLSGVDGTFGGFGFWIGMVLMMVIMAFIFIGGFWLLCVLIPSASGPYWGYPQAPYSPTAPPSDTVETARKRYANGEIRKKSSRRSSALSSGSAGAACRRHT